MKIIEGSITAVPGFLAQGVSAQIKNGTKKDVAIICSTEQCTAGGVFTTNKVHAACIDLNKLHLQDGKAQAIVVNSGNANACTGEQGKKDTAFMASLTAELLNIDMKEVLVASTGVIGVNMPIDRITKGIKESAAALTTDGGHNATEAIMTTDLIEKEVAIEFELSGIKVHMGAIAKGSGMIHPNMATMLCFITTDASISSICLQKALKSAVDQSFNMISVDRDTSTNDMALILANGKAENELINDPDSQEYEVFKNALDYVTVKLAKMIARDGEGANHLIEIKVNNADNYETAYTIARSVSSSNLTKTAVFGQDANWGRILAAAGYSGADFDPEKIDIYLGTEKMAENGMGLNFDEEKAREELQKDTVSIMIDLKSGNYSATAWGCDLSYEYIRINADYRT